MLCIFFGKNLITFRMGSATGKSQGGKRSWTERQIGMLLSYFVLIKLSVIKCLFNYDNAIIIIYKMQVKFINQSKNFFNCQLNLFYLLYNLPCYQHCNFCIYFLDVTYYYINQIIYMLRGGARILVRGGGGNIGQNFHT